jgi:hypothetical protein
MRDGGGVEGVHTITQTYQSTRARTISRRAPCAERPPSSRSRRNIDTMRGGNDHNAMRTINTSHHTMRALHSPHARCLLARVALASDCESIHACTFTFHAHVHTHTHATASHFELVGAVDDLTTRARDRTPVHAHHRRCDTHTHRMRYLPATGVVGVGVHERRRAPA